MDPHSPSIPDRSSRRLVCRFEGGAVYESESDAKFLVVVDQGTLLDFLNDEDREGFEPVTVYEFETAVDRNSFLNADG